MATEADPQFALAIELLNRPDAGVHLQRAIALVEGASADGYAPASELWAVFEAMGVARPQSWERALDRLQLAAEQGSPSAQEQLLLMADNTHDAAIPDRPHASHWSEVRVRASAQRMLVHADRRSLSDSPPVRVIEGFATAAECRWLINRASSRLKPALIVDLDGRQKPDPVRSNKATQFSLLEMDVVLEFIRARISAATRVPVPVFEPTQIFRYSVGEQFKPHHDFLGPKNSAPGKQLRNGQRIATFLIYLNEDFEGGETEFPVLDIRYRGKTGDAIFWANLDLEGRPDARTLHAGLPPTSGEKWILSQWMRDRPPPPG
jgi:hypothetical protein